MAPDLYVKRAGQGAAVILLHGLFGSGANMGALMRALRNQYAVYCVDLPNHGRSGWLANLDLPTMADSLNRWMGAEGLAQAHLVGHSLGGKVAMQLALRYPGSVQSLVVGDIAPVAYTAQHDAVFAALEAVAARDCATREEAASLLALHLPGEESAAVIQFLLAGLQRDDAGILRWRFDLRGIRGAYPLLLAAPQIAPQAAQVYPDPVLFIKGGASDYIQERDWPAVKAFFPAAQIEVMPHCGHWLHAEKPELFNGIVARFIASAGQYEPAVRDRVNEG